MTISLKQPNLLEKLVTSDGRLTNEGLILLTRIVEMLRDHEARIEALEP